MTNEIKRKEYEEKKNKTVTVVSFKDGKRTMTCGSLSYFKAIEEILLKQSQGCECLLVKDLPTLEVSYDRKDYDKYMEVQ